MDSSNNLKELDVQPQYTPDTTFFLNNNYLNNNLNIKNYNLNSLFSNSNNFSSNKKLLFLRHYEFDKKLLKDEVLKKYKFSYFNASNIFNTENLNSLKFFENDQLDDVDESAENLRLKNYKYPIRLIKGVLTKHNISLLTSNKDLNNNIILNYKLNNSDITEKLAQSEQFWGFRQKRYKKLRMFVFPSNKRYDNKTYTYIEQFSNKSNIDKYNLYTGVKNNKYKNEMIPVTLARRLLRTKRTLVLPAHINITLITNSYDVVHS